jgi:hypothetical protein
MPQVDEIELDDVLDEALEEEIETDATADERGEATAEAEAGEEESEDAADPDPRGHVDQPDETLTEEPPAPAAVPPNTTRIGAIDGVPLFYERLATGPKPITLTVARSYLPILERTVKDVKARAPAAFGPLKRISSAGTFVDKPGMHGLARAIDWDRWTFGELEIAPIRRHHASPSRAVRRRYWGLAAICRANSSFVLHGRYDTAHEDHIHQDNGSNVRFAEMESTVKLCQAILDDIFGDDLPIDGGFTAGTQSALQRAMERVQLDGNFQDVTTWKRFLRRSGRLGFRLSVG